jgi:hypothetical protein
MSEANDYQNSQMAKQGAEDQPLRTARNVFRKEYRALTEREKEHIDAIKRVAQALHDRLHTVGGTAGFREMAIARTKLEESVMWAVKAITG